MNKYTLIASGYTDDQTKNGIYVIGLNQEGKGEVIRQYEHPQNPSYIYHLEKDNTLFVANEIEEICKIDRYSIKDDELTYEKSLELPGAGLCHILYDEKRESLYGSCYGSGEVYAVDKDLEEVHGKALTRTQGQTSRAHGGSVSKNGRWLITVDLGRSCLEIYDLELDKQFPNQLVKRQDLGHGTGPREVKLNEIQGKIYVVNELENTLGVYEFNFKNGRVTKEISRLKTSFSTENIKNYPSTSLLTKDGNWLLLANRGYNTISIFKINEDGLPLLHKEHSCHGDWPRYITLTKDEKFLLVANQNSHEISVLSYDQQAAELTLVDKVDVPNPSCITE